METILDIDLTGMAWRFFLDAHVPAWAIPAPVAWIDVPVDAEYPTLPNDDLIARKGREIAWNEAQRRADALRDFKFRTDAERDDCEYFATIAADPGASRAGKADLAAFCKETGWTPDALARWHGPRGAFKPAGARPAGSVMDALSVRQARGLAGELGVKNASRMNKAAAIAAIRATGADYLERVKTTLRIDLAGKIEKRDGVEFVHALSIAASRLNSRFPGETF